MDYRILRYVNSSLPPDSRWLLLQWSAVVGLDRSLDSPLKDLSRMLGLTAQQLKPALDQLRLLGYVIESKTYRGRGRPISSFQVSTELRHRLERLEMPPIGHLEHIESLCQQAIDDRQQSLRSAENLMSGEQRRNRLSPANYWLLSVLLLHAETPGVVRGMSYGGLISLTGMTRERLKSQILKLKNIGIIAHYESGVQRMRGVVRMRSVYFLNIAHPVLMGCDSIGFTALIAAHQSKGEFNYLSGFYEAALVYSELIESQADIAELIKLIGFSDSDVASYEEKKKVIDLRASYTRAYEALYGNAIALLPPTSYLKPATKVFLQLRGMGMGPIIKAHIFAYVVALLSNHWKDLGRKKAIDAPIKPVISVINADFCSIQALDGGSGEHQRELAKAIYALAVNVAMRLRQDLLAIEAHQTDFDFPNGIFSIRRFHRAGNDFFKLSVCFSLSEGVPHLKDTFLGLEGFSLSLPYGFKSLPPVETE